VIHYTERATHRLSNDGRCTLPGHIKGWIANAYAIRVSCLPRVRNFDRWPLLDGMSSPVTVARSMVTTARPRRTECRAHAPRSPHCRCRFVGGVHWLQCGRATTDSLNTPAFIRLAAMLSQITVVGILSAISFPPSAARPAKTAASHRHKRECVCLLDAERMTPSAVRNRKSPERGVAVRQHAPS